MTDPAVIARFEQLTGVMLSEQLHGLFENASPDMDWRDIAIALGDDIADELREMNEPPSGFRPIGETIDKIMLRIGVSGDV